MRLPILFILLAFSLLQIPQYTNAQPKYFVYIESLQQPFIVNIGGNMYASENEGYVLVGKLLSGKQALKISFHQNKFPAKEYWLDIKQDGGWRLVNPANDAQDWILENIYTGERLLSGKNNSPQSINEVEKKVSTTKISNAEVGAPAPKIEVTDTSVVKRVEVKAMEKPIYFQHIKKQDQFADAKGGLVQVFVAYTNAETDTIQIYIPPNPVTAKLPVLKDAVVSEHKCNVATVEEFYKTRLKMAAATNETQMLDIARNELEVLCFSTEQIKNLSTLFLSEANKLLFFKVAKKKIYDPNHFGLLANQLTDKDLQQQFQLLLP